MADYSDKPSDTYVRESTYRAEPAHSSGSMWFIIGGIVVAVGVLFAIFYGAGETTTPVDNGVTIENQAVPPAADPVAPAPEATPATPPADMSAPADPTAPAPAEPAPAPSATEPAPTAPAAGN